MGFIGGLIPIIILIALVFGIGSVITRRRGDEATAPGVGAKQAFFYLFAFAALMVAAAGASMLVGFIVDSLRGGRFVTADENQLAAGIALLVVGTPAWALTWRKLQHAAAADPRERASFVRSLYMYVVEIVSVGLFAGGLVSLGRVLLQADGLNGSDVALPAVWALVWAYHWREEDRLTDEEKADRPFRHFYLYLASMAFLIVMLVGAGMSLHRLLDNSYAALFLDDRVVTPNIWGSTLKNGIVLATVGGLGWWWHWFQATEIGERSATRRIYLYVFGVLFGVVSVVVSITLVLVLFFQWLFGTPSLDPAEDHFRALTGIIPSLLAGASLWGYHSAVLSRESLLPGFESAKRIYNYLVASLSLATLASGLIFLVALFISATVRDARNYLVESAGWQGQLAIVIPLIAVGGGIWAYYWRDVQRSAASKPGELSTSSRRLHIYSVFAISALAALGSLSATLYMFLDAILAGELSGSTLRDAQWAIAILLSTAVISAFYLVVIREDRRVLAESAPEERVSKNLTLLVTGPGADLSRKLTQQGFNVRIWQRTDGEGVAAFSDEQVELAISEVSSSPELNLLVVAIGDQIEVMPYRER